MEDLRLIASILVILLILGVMCTILWAVKTYVKYPADTKNLPSIVNILIILLFMILILGYMGFLGGLRFLN